MASPVATPGPITRLQLDTRISCERCNTLLVPASYKRHLKTVHKDTSIGKQWKCLLCQKVLQTPSRFLQHEKKHKQSANEKPFSCTECKYETDTKYYLQNHKRTMHVAKEGLWICAKGKCAENPRSFINNYLLKKHQDCHEEIKCEKCDKKFTAKRNFRRHIKTVHKDNLEERNVTVSVNIAHIDPEDVAVGDLVVVPLDPSPLDPLTNDWLSNYELPLEFVFIMLTKPFCFIARPE